MGQKGSPMALFTEIPTVLGRDRRPLDVLSDRWAAAELRDDSFRLLWCNRLYEHWTRESQTALAGSRLARIFGTAGGQERESLLQRVLTSGQPAEYVQVWKGVRVLGRSVPGIVAENGTMVVLTVLVNQPSNPLSDSNLENLPPLPVLEHNDLGPLAALSRRELEVLYLAGSGSRTSDAAGRLFRAEKTVSNHMTNIHKKLGVQSRAAMSRLAAERGLLHFTFQEWSRIIDRKVEAERAELRGATRSLPIDGLHAQ